MSLEKMISRMIFVRYSPFAPEMLAESLPMIELTGPARLEPLRRDRRAGEHGDQVDGARRPGRRRQGSASAVGLLTLDLPRADSKMRGSMNSKQSVIC